MFDLMFNVAPGMSFAFIPSRFNKDVALLKLLNGMITEYSSFKDFWSLSYCLK